MIQAIVFIKDIKGNLLKQLQTVNFGLMREYTVFQNQTLRSITLHINCISQYYSANRLPLCPKDKRYMVKVYSFLENWGMANRKFVHLELGVYYYLKVCHKFCDHLS